jgi:hypothetical protein
MTPEELKRRYDAGERDFRGADLRGANLEGANLSFARLQGANLRDANLRGANLRYALLRGANLRYALLRGANLKGAYLERANLRYAYLYRADPRDANLEGADLKGACLSYANLRNANLKNTCLAPDAVCAAPPTDGDIKRAGLELRGDKVYGWRTKESTCCGSTTYEVGKEYTAPWFSVDHNTECHPGLYLAGKEWLDENYKGFEVVRVYCLRSELVHAGDKWRARRLWVVEAEEPSS